LRHFFVGCHVQSLAWCLEVVSTVGFLFHPLNVVPGTRQNTTFNVGRGMSRQWRNYLQKGVIEKRTLLMTEGISTNKKRPYG
jgi:hypothetical protein